MFKKRNTLSAQETSAAHQPAQLMSTPSCVSATSGLEDTLLSANSI